MPEMIVTVGERKIHCFFDTPPLLTAILQEAKLPLTLPCAGNHRCGKCKIRVCGGLSPVSGEEAAFLSPEELAAGIRLACFARVTGDVEIFPQEAHAKILSLVILPPHRLTRRGFALAVDIGTTTVAMQLYDLQRGVLLSEALEANRQSAFGTDVISRIDYDNQDATATLTQTIRRQLSQLSAVCLRQGSVAKIDAAVITGNTTMLHFWEGLSPQGIAVAPFLPSSLFGGPGTQALGHIAPFLPPCLGAYIGADTTCAILAAALLAHKERAALLIDLGTNGEIVLQSRGKLYCASTAMGPAFEGATLAFGMQAGDGAISAVSLTEGVVSYTLLAGESPRGLCGSGILDALCVMLRQGVVDETGRMNAMAAGVEKWKGQNAWRIPQTDVYVTQQDVRKLQLAKAAVCAGIQTLLEHTGIAPGEIDDFYVAGGFGHYMNPASAAAIGLFPPVLAPKLQVLGNAALSGAALLLLDETAEKTLQEIKTCAREIPLSGNSAFSEHYIDNMMFEQEN